MQILKNLKSKNKAQQIVEFAFIAPLLIIIIIVIIEFSYALNSRASLIEAVRYSTDIVTAQYNPTETFANQKIILENTVKSTVIDYFNAHGLPNSDTIDVTIVEINGADTLTVICAYNYKPTFTLPFGVFLGGIQGYKFTAQHIIDKTQLQNNDYSYALTSEQLASFWKTSTDLDGRDSNIITDIDQYNDSNTEIRQQIAFMLDFKVINPDGTSPSGTFARLFDWWGQDLLTANTILSMTTGTLWVKSPYYGVNWFDSKIPITWIISALGYTQATYTRYFKTAGPISYTDHRLNLASTDAYLNNNVMWCGQETDCEDSLVDSAISVQNKYALAFLMDATNSESYGTYDFVDNTNNKLNTPQSVPYTFHQSNVNYALKMFIPNDNFPIARDNLFKGNFKIQSDGTYATGSNYDIIDCYMDNDGDEIPNNWDDHPDYPDANANGKLDGLDNTIIISTECPEDILESDMVPGYTHSPGAGVVYTISSYSDTGTNIGSLPFDINTNEIKKSDTYSKIPRINATMAEITFKRTEDTSTSTVVALYFKYTDENGFIHYKRVTQDWANSSNQQRLQKIKFLHGGFGPKYFISVSNELLELEYYSNSPFYSGKRITN